MPSTFAAFTFQTNKDTNMKTITELQIDFITLYEKMYAVVPSFGTFKDWNDPSWLARMYDDLYRTYNSELEEFWD